MPPSHIELGCQVLRAWVRWSSTLQNLLEGYRLLEIRVSKIYLTSSSHSEELTHRHLSSRALRLKYGHNRSSSLRCVPDNR